MYIFIYIYISLYVLWNIVLFRQSRLSESSSLPGGTLAVGQPRLLEAEGEELGHRPGGGACVWRGFGRSMGYALTSSTLMAWGLMAPVRAGLAWPAEGRGSGSLLVMAPGAILPSHTALRTSRMPFTWETQELTETWGLCSMTQHTTWNGDAVDLLKGPQCFSADGHNKDTNHSSMLKYCIALTLPSKFWLKLTIYLFFLTCMKWNKMELLPFSVCDIYTNTLYTTYISRSFTMTG